MAKLPDVDIAEEGAWLDCCAPYCERRGVRSGQNGNDLPFCREHLEDLPRELFDKLVEIAEESVFDQRSAATAEGLVLEALLAIADAKARRR